MCGQDAISTRNSLCRQLQEYVTIDGAVWTRMHVLQLRREQCVFTVCLAGVVSGKPYCLTWGKQYKVFKMILAMSYAVLVNIFLTSHGLDHYLFTTNFQ